MKDPESVKYRNIKLKKYAPTLYEKLQFITTPNKDHPDVLSRIRRAVTYTLPYELCGEVNARNSFGAYDGYKLFFAKLDETSTAFIDAEPDDDAAKVLCGIDIQIVYQEQ